MASTEPEPIPKICLLNCQKTYQFDCQFTVDNFNTRSQVFKSDTFAPPGLQIPRFYLQCQRNYHSGSSYHLKVDLYLEDRFQNKDYHFVKSTISILDQNEQKTNSTILNSAAMNTDIRLCLINMANIAGSCLEGNKITLFCEFTFQIDDKTSNFASKIVESEEKLDQKQRIVDDLDKMLQSGKFSDFVLQLGDKKLRVHKNILAARSPYFAAMFTGDFEERKTNKVDIADVDAELFEEMIRFLYTSKIPSIDKNAAEFLALADKYQLDSLKSICENALYDQLDSNTMVNTYLLADTYNATELKSKTIEFISTRTSPQDVIKAMLSNKNMRMFEAMNDYEKEKKK